MENMGKLFVIEGTDASGKETQMRKLKERFQKEGIAYKGIEFPNYKSNSSELAQDPKEISPYIASTFYAADRYITFKKEYSAYYEKGGIILADRYTTSNMVHQAGKIKDDVERQKFLDWLWDFEFHLYGLPVPTQVIFLNMPTKYALELMKHRKNKITNNTQKDIHEKSPEHLKDSYEEAIKLSKKYNWYEVQCVKNETIRTIEDIHEEIYTEIKKYLQ